MILEGMLPTEILTLSSVIFVCSQVLLKDPEKATACFADLNKNYTPGSRISIKEPWYKVLIDGSVGIRVEDMDMISCTVPIK